MLALVEMDCTRMPTFNIKKAFYLFIYFYFVSFKLYFKYSNNRTEI